MLHTYLEKLSDHQKPSEQPYPISEDNHQDAQFNSFKFELEKYSRTPEEITNFLYNIDIKNRNLQKQQDFLLKQQKELEEIQQFRLNQKTENIILKKKMSGQYFPLYKRFQNEELEKQKVVEQQQQENKVTQINTDLAELTFQPKINEISQNIPNKSFQEFSDYQQQWLNIKNKKLNDQVVEKQLEENKEYTYQPQINKQRQELNQNKTSNSLLKQSRYEQLYQNASIVQQKKEEQREEHLRKISPFKPKLCEKSRIMAKKYTEKSFEERLFQKPLSRPYTSQNPTLCPESNKEIENIDPKIQNRNVQMIPKSNKSIEKLNISMSPIHKQEQNSYIQTNNLTPLSNNKQNVAQHNKQPQLQVQVNSLYQSPNNISSELQSDKNFFVTSAKSNSNIIGLLNLLDSQLKQYNLQQTAQNQSKEQTKDIFKNKYNGKYYFEPVTQQNVQSYLDSLEKEKDNFALNFDKLDHDNCKAQPTNVSDFSKNIPRSFTPNSKKVSQHTSQMPQQKMQPYKYISQPQKKGIQKGNSHQLQQQFESLHQKQSYGNNKIQANNNNVKSKIQKRNICPKDNRYETNQNQRLSTEINIQDNSQNQIQYTPNLNFLLEMLEDKKQQILLRKN